MSWCDRLGSTPGIGYQLDWHTLPSEILLGALSPFTDKMTSGDEQRFSIETKEPLRLSFTSFEGVQYGLEPTKIYLGFTHRATIKTGVGGIPSLVPSSKIAPYTELLAEMQGYLFDTMMIINKLKQRKLAGIGVVSTTVVSESDLPPGLQKLLAYVSKPWHGALQSLTFQAQTVIAESDNYTQKCNHTIVKPAQADEPLQLTFDFQRIFKKNLDVDMQKLRTVTDDVKAHAINYFEQLAQGDLIDG
jgi:hypothetical protein